MHRVLAGLVVSALCVAQEAPDHPELFFPTERYTLQFGEAGVPLEALLEIAASRGMKIDTAASRQNGLTIRLRGSLDLGGEGFELLVESVLYREGFLCECGDGGSRKLVPDIRTDWRVRPAEEALSLRDTPRWAFVPEAADLVFVPVALANVLALQAHTLLSGFLPAGIEVGLLAGGRSVLLQGRRSDVELAEQLFRAIDAGEGAPPVVVTALEVRHIVPESFAQALTALLRATAAEADPRIPREAPAVGAHPSRRALILCGTEAQVALAKQIVALLDKPPK